MSGPAIHWREQVHGGLLTDVACDHLNSRLGIRFHGVTALGASTVGHRFITDEEAGSVVLRAVHTSADEVAIELAAFGPVDVDVSLSANLRALTREALADLPRPQTEAAIGELVTLRQSERSARGAGLHRSRVPAWSGDLAVAEVAPRIETAAVEENRGSFTIEPLDRGFGYTFGNSLRRVLLSSLAGAAVTSLRIEGVAHELSTIAGVKEDVTDIVLNLKGVVCRMHSDATEIEAPLVVTGPGEITAKDIDLPSGVEILNPDAHIATLERRTKLEVYLTIGRGRGYRPAEENKSADQPIGVIPIDSIFSPVRRVAYAVEQARVGQKTDFDKLTLDIETDGSIDPHAALREAAEILISQLAIFTDADRVVELRDTGGLGALEPGLVGGPGEPGAGPGGRPANAMDDILIEELELGVRSYNCLKRAGIQTVGDLISKTENELNAIPNFGKKSIDEVIETLEGRGLHLEQDRH